MKPVLAKIEPGKEEKNRINSLAREIISEIRKHGYPARVMGSVAKGTWLAGDVDIDIFVFFDQKVGEKELEKDGLKVGKAVMKKFGAKLEIGYAQHPYVRGKIQGVRIDIVPCYKLKKMQIRSAVDRTPFHTSYVKSQLDQKGRKEAMLLKQFLKGQGLYGSELRVEGFSGYLAELLIIRYGSFNSAIAAARKWKRGKIVDIKKYYTSKEYTHLREMFPSPLIAIDPVDLNRNVSAVLNEKNFERFVKVANRYHKKPSEVFFFPKPVEPVLLANLPNLLFITLNHDKVVEDILWPQMRKTVGNLADELERNGFKVGRTGAWSNGKAILWLETSPKASPTYEHLGPPLKLKEHAKAFRKKYPKAKAKNGRLVATKKRKYTTADGFVRSYLKKGIGAGSHLKTKSAEVVVGAKIAPYYKGEFAAYLTKWLKNR